MEEEEQEEEEEMTEKKEEEEEEEEEGGGGGGERGGGEEEALVQGQHSGRRRQSVRVRQPRLSVLLFKGCACLTLSCDFAPVTVNETLKRFSSLPICAELDSS